MVYMFRRPPEVWSLVSDNASISGTGKASMETLYALLALCEGNPSYSPHNGPVMQKFDVFFGVRLNKSLNKLSIFQQLRTMPHNLRRLGAKSENVVRIFALTVELVQRFFFFLQESLCWEGFGLSYSPHSQWSPVQEVFLLTMGFSSLDRAIKLWGNLNTEQLRPLVFIANTMSTHELKERCSILVRWGWSCLWSCFKVPSSL